MSYIEKLSQCLEEFKKKCPLPELSELKLSRHYDILNEFDDYYPDSEHPGVYILLDSEKKILYIGKASCSNNLGYRLGAHIERGPDGKGMPKDDVSEGTQYIVTISVPDDWAFMAPALEEFLIREINLGKNVTGKRSGV